MVVLIKNAEVYEPRFLGKQDILILGDKIAAVGKNLQAEFNGAVHVETIDGTDFAAVPGFIDSHEHIMGGGGEGGFHTRTPEAILSGLTCCGITTVVGCIGTDGISRDMTGLLAKAHGLENEGITAYCYTGSYQIPPHTLTGSVMKDLMMLDKVIGVGEIAISDHRSSQPSYEEFVRLAADARVGGMLSGKAGILNIHLGDGARHLDLIERVVHETEIPVTQFLPTHINRNSHLFEAAVSFAREGGCVDFTGNEDIDSWEKITDEVRVCTGIRRLLDAGISENNFTISSDGQGSLPRFSPSGQYEGLGIGKASSLLKEVRECVMREHLPLELALRAVTSNPARILKLNTKGHIAPGSDGDICLLHKDSLLLHTVIAKGRVMVRNSVPEVRGTFE